MGVEKIAMNKFFAFILLLLATSLALSCGSSGRQLQSITIMQLHETGNGDQLELVATGTFSVPPTTVTPLPVFWFADLPPNQYTLTTQPFLIQCSAGHYQGPFIAMAPADPNAPSSGSIATTKMVTESTSCAQVKG